MTGNTGVEELVVDLIRNEYDGLISKYLLEGHLLYTFNLKPSRVYRVIMGLELDEIIEGFEGSDGEYYKLMG